MSERRWNPTTEQWVLTATHRMDRTFLPPADFCPLCPTKPGAALNSITDVPASSYDIAVIDNKFPSMQTPPPKPDVSSSPLYPVDTGDGICEVVLYTQVHGETLTDQPVERIEKLIRVWQDRFTDLGSRPNVDYVFIFENKGKIIGVTIDHAHGQIYGFPFVPPIPKTELEAAKKHQEATGRRLWDDIIARELQDEVRIVASNDTWLAVIPFYARYPYEVHVMPRRHLTDITEFTEAERWGLSRLLKVILQKFDNLFGFSLPYMMVMHQAPTDGQDYDYYRFHIEFYPPNRTENKLKFLAGSESGAGVFINDSLPEAKAKELRAIEPVMMES